MNFLLLESSVYKVTSFYRSLPTSSYQTMIFSFHDGHWPLLISAFICGCSIRECIRICFERKLECKVKITLCGCSTLGPSHRMMFNQRACNWTFVTRTQILFQGIHSLLIENHFAVLNSFRQWTMSAART